MSEHFDAADIALAVEENEGAANRKLKQQLAASQAHNVMMREALEFYASPDTAADWEQDHGQTAQAALAATDDLGMYILCEREPVAWSHSCNVLCLDNVELWIAKCPHCGMPASAARKEQK